MRVCPMKIRAQCYATLVRPIMVHHIGSPVWDPHLQKDINCLEMVQRRSARFVYQDLPSRVCMLNKAAKGLVSTPIDV